MIKRFIKELYLFNSLLITKRNLIWSMAKRDIATQYIGSFLGFVWTFIDPIVTVFIFWVVFGLGFKVRPCKEAPFVVWLTAGMAIWMVFSKILNESSNIIIVNSNLIKNTLFHSHILPIVKIISNLIIHFIFITILLVLLYLNKMPFNIYFLQALYYLLAMCFLSLGLCWLTSALSPFIRDIPQIVKVIVDLGFWATPVMWELSIMPPKLQSIFRINPIYYLVQGYRESFLYFTPFWHHPRQTLEYWTVTLIILFLGAILFKRLKPHFADVL
ncbi:MAG: ABC transporter permease [bacterium]